MVLPKPTSSAMSRLTRGISSARDHRVELVVLDVDAAAERRLECPHVGGGDRAPAHGVEEGVEAARLVEAGGFGQGRLLEHAGAGLELPDDLELLAERVVLDGGEGDEVLLTVEPGRSGSGGRALLATSVTTKRRWRTSTSWPGSGTDSLVDVRDHGEAVSFCIGLRPSGTSSGIWVWVDNDPGGAEQGESSLGHGEPVQLCEASSLLIGEAVADPDRVLQVRPPDRQYSLIGGVIGAFEPVQYSFARGRPCLRQPRRGSRSSAPAWRARAPGSRGSVWRCARPGARGPVPRRSWRRRKRRRGFPYSPTPRRRPRSSLNSASISSSCLPIFSLKSPSSSTKTEKTSLRGLIPPTESTKLNW